MNLEGAWFVGNHELPKWARSRSGFLPGSEVLQTQLTHWRMTSERAGSEEGSSPDSSSE